MERDRSGPDSTRADRLDPLMPIVADFNSAALTADTAVAICKNRLDALVTHAALARIARDVWAGRAGPAEPLAGRLAELAEELHRHRDRMRVLHDQLAQIADSDTELPELSDADFASALVRVIQRQQAAQGPPADPNPP